jgi:hypothetical protein
MTRKKKLAYSLELSFQISLVDYCEKVIQRTNTKNINQRRNDVQNRDVTNQS